MPEPAPGPTGAWLGAADLAPRFETLEDVRVRYVRAGTGPPVVLLHGFASSIYTWKEVLPALAREHEVVALDLPGFGQSDQPVDLSFELYPRVVLALMDRLGLARVSLVGNSMGGAVAIVVAARAPERVEALVIVDSAGYNLRARDRPRLLRLAGAKPMAAFLDRLPVRRLLVRTALRQVFHDQTKVTAERVDEYLAPVLRPGAMAAGRSLLASLRERAGLVEELAPRVKAPTLILWGSEDGWIPVAHADRFATAIEGSRKLVIEGCGHMPQEERPAEFLAAVEGFLPRGASARSNPP